jgi:selenocysteine lyase/cysteine desulfurase
MTSLNYTLSRTLGRDLQPGDEIVVTRLDHDANVAPWLDLAQDRGLVVRLADVHADTTLDLSDLERLLGPRTRVVAFPWAANTVGTIVDASAVCDLAHQAGALAWVDAVQYAPHEPVDVRAIGADVLLCSAYKFCGPHLGIAFGRRELLESWRPYKARPAPMEPVGHRFETGTQAYELLGGLLAAFAYLDSLGGPAAVAAWERQLGDRLLAGLPPGATTYGLPTMAGRVPTFLVNFPGVPSAKLSPALADLGFGVWSDGNYYAPGLHDRIAWGEALRIGLAHYNTLEEMDRFNQALATVVAAHHRTGGPGSRRARRSRCRWHTGPDLAGHRAAGRRAAGQQIAGHQVAGHQAGRAWPRPAARRDPARRATRRHRRIGRRAVVRDRRPRAAGQRRPGWPAARPGPGTLDPAGHEIPDIRSRTG